MKRHIFFVMLSFLITSVAADDLPIKKFIGVWQYPAKTVWIKINDKGEAFQCRIAGSTVYKSSGKFIGSDKITWDTIWGEDKIILTESDAITLEGSHGPFTFIKINSDLAEECKTPI